MKSLRFAVFFTTLLSAALLAQSRPAPLDQPLAPNTPTPNSLSQPGSTIHEKMVENYGKLPLSFEANQGQTDPRVKFLSRGSGYRLFLTGDESVFSLRGSEAEPSKSPVGDQLHSLAVTPTSATVLRMKLVKANRNAKVTGEDELPGKSNYFIGNDPKKWRTNVPTYSKVRYEGVYSGIDLVYYGNQRQLEYDFVIAPGADPRPIQFDVRGAKKISRDRSGDLVLQTGAGQIRWRKPVVYQEKDGTRQEIDAHYVITHKNRVRFEVADYDLGRPLFIDPLVYSTYLGGGGNDQGSGIAVDSSGNAYVTGYTESTNFPTMNPFQPANGGGFDAFVTEFNPTGSALVYSTYLGGRGNDAGSGITLDSSGDAYVTGYTFSTNFPTMNPFQPSYGGGGDAFVTELNPTGSALIYSTYLGGRGYDQGSGIAVDSSGNAYVTGYTESTNFPTKDPFQPANGGDSDAFVTEFNPAGSALVYSTYLGGSASDYGSGIAVDSSGNAYVTGSTFSTNFPTMDPFQSANGGADDAFVTEFNPTGSALIYSTYLGGIGTDSGSGIAVDSSGDAYVTGYTGSTNFPTRNPFQPANGGGNDAFVTKFNPTGSALVYSTYLGGSANDYGSGIAVDSSGNAYVTGYTFSTNFPTSMNPFQPANGGDGDAFVTEFNPTGSALAYSTYLGGGGSDYGTGIAVDSSGNAYVTGYTGSTNFPTMNPFQPANGGDGDAFVTVLIPQPSPEVTLVPPNLNFGNQTVNFTSAPQISTLTNAGPGTLMITSIVSNSSEFPQTNNCPASIPQNGSCQISVTFTPSGTGTQNGDVSITDNASGSPQMLPLTGVGVLPAVAFSPPSLNFGNQTVNITSAPQISTLTNTGAGTLTITSIASNSSEFPETNNCPASIPPNGSCQISVTFTPSATGTQNAAVSITDNAPGSPQMLPLTGVGVLPAVTFSPPSLNFPNQVVYTTSPRQKVTLTNTGLGILKIKSAKIAAQFGVKTDCGETLNPGASCSANVAFRPTTKGPVSGSITLTDNAPDSPQQVPLSGTGTFVQLTPTSLNFGNQPINTTSPPKYVTLENQGDAPLNFTGTGISIAGSDPDDFAQQNNCPSSLASGGYCTITVTFTPLQDGKRTADVSVSDDGGGSPQLVPLAGSGTP